MKKFDYSLRLKLKTDKAFYGPGVLELMERINHTQSMNMAAKEMGMSYNKAWRIIKNAEEEIGYPLVIKVVGGSNGGGSTITPEGQALMDKFIKFQEEMYRVADQCFEKIFFEERDHE